MPQNFQWYNLYIYYKKINPCNHVNKMKSRWDPAHYDVKVFLSVGGSCPFFFILGSHFSCAFQPPQDTTHANKAKLNNILIY